MRRHRARLIVEYPNLGHPEPPKLIRPEIARAANRNGWWPAETQMLNDLIFRGQLVITTELEAEIFMATFAVCCGYKVQAQAPVYEISGELNNATDTPNTN